MPKKNATATERNMPIITERAFSVFSKSPMSAILSPEEIFTSATANAAPRSSKTMDTVVDVGKPRELNTSSKIISTTITAIKMHIRS